jgi:GNAT superfamily N-acetyltransferase
VNTDREPNVTPQVELPATSAAGDEVLVEDLVRLINRAYSAGEAGLWVEGTMRTTPAEVVEAIRSGGMLVASVEGRIAGCGCVRALDATTADLGFVSVAPEEWGSGVGREVVRSAEDLMRSRGVTTMQLELLVPRGWVHPAKDRVRAWYARLGYRIVRSARFEEIAAHAASQLATPCEFLVFRKPLAGAPGVERSG